MIYQPAHSLLTRDRFPLKQEDPRRVACHNGRSGRLLIVDEQGEAGRQFERMLRAAGYHQIFCIYRADRLAALVRGLDPDLLILAFWPAGTGLQTLVHLKVLDPLDHVPILALIRDEERENRRRALELGADDCLTIPCDQLEAEARIANLLKARWFSQETVRREYEPRTYADTHSPQSMAAQREVAYRLALAAEYRDNETGAHIIRMGRYAGVLGRAIGLSRNECELLVDAMPMHDIGKIGIPDRILLKPGPLSEDEWIIMRNHTVIGGELLAGSQSSLLQMAHTIALTHHERWNGTGYPNRLAGEAIPLVGRLCAICDVFDALTSDRPYKPAWTIEAALAEIRAGAGKHFDPDLVRVFEQQLPAMVEIKRAYADSNGYGQTLNGLSATAELLSESDYRVQRR
ncbi:MAG: HD domain-containing protein [Nitrospirae bacterium]|nr:MAG: HD domain-containing protein [Nitrospirota bacterium]